MSRLMPSVAVVVCGNLLQDKKKRQLLNLWPTNSSVPSQNHDNKSSQGTFLVFDSFTYILVYKSVPYLPERALDCVSNLPSALSVWC